MLATFAVGQTRSRVVLLLGGLGSNKTHTWVPDVRVV